MVLPRLLRTSAALPLRVAAAGANTTSAIVGAYARAATTAVSGGVALATTPLRGAADVLSSLTAGEPPAKVVGEFFGATPTRRCWRGPGRAWIEVRGLDGSERGGAVASAVLAAVRAEPGVASAVLNYPLRRLVVSFDGQGPSLRALCDAIGAAEKAAEKRALHPDTSAKPSQKPTQQTAQKTAQKTKPADPHPIDVPGDALVLAGRMVALTANAAGLCVAAAGRALPVPRLPLGIAAPVIVIDYQPRLRGLLEKRFGPAVTDTALAVATAAAHTLTLSPASLAVDLLMHLARVAESRSAARAWALNEPQLARHAECADAFPAKRPTPPPRGPVERHADRSGLAQAIAATTIGVLTRNPNAAATAALVAAPKATRTARESFAATLGRGLADDHGVLPMRPEALRRLDRVDAVLIDPRALTVDELRVTRIRGAPEHDRSAVFEWAQTQLERGALAAGWHAAADRPEGRRGATNGDHGATNGDSNRPVEVFIRRAHHPLASAVVAEARRSGAEVISLDVDDLDELRSTFDDLRPAAGPTPTDQTTDQAFDAALADAVEQLKRGGRTVAVLSRAAPQTLSLADVAIGICGEGASPPWHAHLLVADLAAAWRVLHALPGARAASRRGVEIATAASLLGALLMVPGVRGRGPGPVTAGAAAGLWTGFWLARRALRATVPPAGATYDWHAMSPEQVRRILPRPSGTPGHAVRTSRLTATARTSVGVADRLFGPAHRAVSEVTTAMRDELSDPLTPILATGATASALLGSPVDAVLVGSVLTFNSALAATQQVRAHRLLRRLLAVHAPPARLLVTDPGGTRRYADIESAQLRPGDLVEVRPSEVVPADARLLEATDLEVDESSLTGESLPVIKGVRATPGASLAERSCMVFGGTTVMAGTGVAVVTAVGAETQARRATEALPVDGSAVGLQAQLRELTNRAWPVSIAGGALVSALGLLRRAGPHQAVTSGVAVTVAAVPEGLALVATLAQQAAARRLAKLGVLVRTPRSVEALGRVDVVCFDKTGTLSENRLRVSKVYAAAGASPDDVLSCAARATPPPDGAGHHAHATDGAISAAANGSGGPAPAGPTAHLPFRSGRPYSASVSGRELTLKGAPEVVLTACTQSDPATERTVRRMAAAGLRVIAVAKRRLSDEQAASARADPDALNSMCRAGLEIVGLLGLSDTPRPEAAELLTSLASHDIGVRLITGDHPITAAAIATELGIGVRPQEVVSGNEWEALSRRGQERAVADRVVFARMSPENKVQIVQTLERLGQVCAMVGDGANDAAAIRAATVGIGVAARGSDPARTAADVMLLDGRISSLLDALDEGRQLWRRVQAAVSILLGGNAGEVVFALIGSAVIGRATLNARQLLLVNMLTDALPAAALAVSAPNARVRSAGRGPDRAALWRTVAVRGGTTAAGATLAWVLASLTGRQRRAATVALVALVATQLGQTLLDSHSPMVVATAIGSLLAMAAAISTPGVSQLLGSTPLGPLGWTQALSAALAATTAAAVAPRLLALRTTGAPPAADDSSQSRISTTPARQSTAYSSRNGTVKTRAMTSVSGSALTETPPVDTPSTLTPAHDTTANTP